jgi:hypothetical protein
MAGYSTRSGHGTKNELIRDIHPYLGLPNGDFGTEIDDTMGIYRCRLVGAITVYRLVEEVTTFRSNLYVRVSIGDIILPKNRLLAPGQ